MSTDSVIETLLSALEKTPEDQDMRLHIAELLLASEDFKNAAAHYDIILQKEPANLAALQGAAKVATQLGNETKAAGYQQLLSALGASTSISTANSNVSSITAVPDAKQYTNLPEQDKLADQPAKLKTVDNTDNVTVGPWDDFEAPITPKRFGTLGRLDCGFRIA